jgi:hypothetical protein
MEECERSKVISDPDASVTCSDAGPTHTSWLCLVLYMYMHTKASGFAVIGHL